MGSPAWEVGAGCVEPGCGGTRGGSGRRTGRGRSACRSGAFRDDVSRFRGRKEDCAGCVAQATVDDLGRFPIGYCGPGCVRRWRGA